MKKYKIEFAAGKDKSHNFGLSLWGSIEVDAGTVVLSGHNLNTWWADSCGMTGSTVCAQICCCGCFVSEVIVHVLIDLLISKSSISLPLSLVSEVGGEGKQVSFTAEHPKTQVKHPVCIELPNPEAAREVASLLSQDVPGDV